MEKIKLTEKEVEYLNDFVKRGRKSARELTKAHALLLVNDGETEMEVKDTLRISRATVSNIKKKYREEGLQNALAEKPRSGQPKKYTDKHEAEVITQACTESPDGCKRWTLTLLTEEMRKKGGFETINKESIRLILKKAKLSLG
ncbi:MAG: Homeodomain-like domain protein [Candidatus Argoarchaeum ethanivorans]|uniref:Homeodomain-like domain protein n=1 Tax=Candidatus Argoarchaeum ethanivorans TaxID=2608793 RepID=A0A811T6H9_9EURY|nr:MAG: Homeodomain-like domain protein [Candidatus Argoarchaeum ethanivorans]